MRLAIFALLMAVLAFAYQGNAAEFTCNSDVPTESYSPEEQALVDTYWDEVLTYLGAYHAVLTQPSGRCLDSAEAVIQTYDGHTGTQQSRCIMRYSDVKQVMSHVKAVLDEPEKAKACFDPQKPDANPMLYTPSVTVQQSTKVSRWLNRPLLTDYYREMGGEVGQSGLELNKNFLEITTRTNALPHWPTDVSINGLPVLWSSVGWLPMYSKRPDAINKRFRGGYLYAEVMGPYGNLRIDTIDEEKVEAEIGLTVQLFNSAYPFHHHDPQEIYINLTLPKCVDQNTYALMHWDNPALIQERRNDGWAVHVDGASGAWKQWFRNLNTRTGWLAYIERNAIHAFFLKEGCNQTIENSGLVTSWARTTSRTSDQNTHICEPALAGGESMMPWTKGICHIRE
ncbi:MAG: dimethylsulfonioproprionate lyase family protein [Rhodospirillales bacterium]